MQRDRLGRRRQPEQGQGLRSLHPVLPDQWASRVLRVAMSEDDWRRLEALVRRVASDQPTQARAYGAALSHLLHGTMASTDSEPEPLDWLDWERRKTLQTLRRLRPGA